jgi:hypothetical protein
MELFTLYAPEAPWSTQETLEIFSQTIRQLGSLVHTTSTKMPHFYDYYRILDLLAEVKIPVLLVDLYKVNDDHDRARRRRRKHKKSRQQPSQDTALDTVNMSEADSDEESEDENSHHHVSNTTSQEALQVLTELFRTLLGSVRNEHPREILDYCEKIMTSCIEEFFDTSVLPVPILDELLLAIGQGRTVLVVQQPQQSSQLQQARSKRRGVKKAPPAAGAPMYAPQLNPSYVVASAVVRHNVERLSAPIATLLNGLVNNDARSIGESTLTTQLEEYRESSDASDLSPEPEEDKRRNSKGNKDKTTPAEQAILDLANAIGEPQPQQQDSHVTSHVWNIIYELQVVEPSTLTTVIGNLASSFETSDFGQRVMVTQTLGKLFRGHHRKDSTNLTMAVEYNPCFRQWLLRSADKRLEIRQLMLPHLMEMARACPDTNATGPKVELVREVHAALLERLSKDPSPEFRKTVIQQLSNVAYGHRRVLPAHLMRAIGTQVKSKNKEERRDALTGLVQTYFRQYIKYHLSSVMQGGDDCPIEVVLAVLEKCCRSSPVDAMDRIRLSLDKSPKGRNRRNVRRSKGKDEDSDEDEEGMEENERRKQDDFDYYQWIPSILFEAASYTDAMDSDMRSRVVMLIDELLLGCELRGPDDRKHLTSTARATGLAVVVDGVRSQSHLAWHWMGALLDERAKLQNTLKAYINARADIRNHVTGKPVLSYITIGKQFVDFFVHQISISFTWFH